MLFSLPQDVASRQPQDVASRQPKELVARIEGGDWGGELHLARFEARTVKLFG